MRNRHARFFIRTILIVNLVGMAAIFAEHRAAIKDMGARPEKGPGDPAGQPQDRRPCSPNAAALAGDYDLLAAANATFTGGATGDQAGYSVAGVGDVNGDGYADVLIGVLGYSSSRGRAYLFYGNNCRNWLAGNYGLNLDTANATFTGEAGSNNAGCAVAGAGDVNGDGYADFLIGATGYSDHKGRAYLFYGNGSANLLRGEYVLGTATANATFTGEAGSNYAGCAVAGAGDVNGDGYADLLVGASGYSSLSGRTYLFYGNGSSNLLRGEYVLGTATANATFTGEAGSNNAGSSVAGAGDVNGDGYADFLIGATGYNSYTGRVYLLYGNGSANLLRGDYALGTASENATFTGEGMSNYAGYTLAGAGDVNGDGYADLLIGAFGYSGDTGRAYLLYGNESSNLLRGEYVLGPATANATFTGGATGDQSGESVAGAGDVNGDGYADLLIGAFGYSSYTGRAYLFCGNESSNLLRGEYVLGPATANATFTGEAGSDCAGGSVAGAGDVNGDGYPDFLIGATGYSDHKGRAYLFYGAGRVPARIADLMVDSSTPSSIILTWTAPGDDAWVGSTVAYTFRYSTTPITAVNWAFKQVVADPPNPQAGGTLQSYTVGGLAAGTDYYFAIVAVDDESRSSPLSNVPQVTTAGAGGPAIVPPADVTYVEGDTAPHVISWAVTDASTSNPTYTVRVNWDDPTAPAAWVSGTPVTFNAGGWLAGTYGVEITANDGYGGSATDVVVVTVNPALPAITAPADITYTEGDAGSHAISWTITDPTTSNPTYTVRINWGAPTAPAAWISGTPVTHNVTAWAPGTYFVEVTAADGQGHNATDVVVVTVKSIAAESAPDLDWGLILAAAQVPVWAIALVASGRRGRNSGTKDPPRRELKV